MNADGSGQTRLTNHIATEGMAAWSPDGSKVVFQSNRDGNLELYVANIDGSGLTRLTSMASRDELPDWQPVPVSAPPPPTATATPTTAPAAEEDELRELVAECVEHQGTYNSLIVKLDSGELRAFINHVRSQSGKKIPADCADELIEVATEILNAS